MEKALRKLAKQLEGLDEASLMSLWPKYAESVRNFEPSRRWEEDALILCLLQAVRFKNQLFNYHWAQSAPGGEGLDVPPPLRPEPAPRPSNPHSEQPPSHPSSQPTDHADSLADSQTPQGADSRNGSNTRGKVLSFPGAKPGK